MGLFGLGKKSSPATNSKVPAWLLQADKDLTYAKQTNNIGNCEKWLTPACGSEFADKLYNDDKEPAGMERYRKIQWVMESPTSYIKVVTYEDIELSYRVAVPLGEAYKERWTLSSDRQKIERMELLDE